MNVASTCPQATTAWFRHMRLSDLEESFDVGPTRHFELLLYTQPQPPQTNQHLSQLLIIGIQLSHCQINSISRRKRHERRLHRSSRHPHSSCPILQTHPAPNAPTCPAASHLSFRFYSALGLLVKLVCKQTTTGILWNQLVWLHPAVRKNSQLAIRLWQIITPIPGPSSFGCS